MSATSGRVVIVCDAYTTKPMRADQASRTLEQIERLGACSHAHTIEPAPERLRTS